MVIRSTFRWHTYIQIYVGPYKNPKGAFIGSAISGMRYPLTRPNAAVKVETGCEGLNGL